MKNEILNRTKAFAIDCWKFCFQVPKSREFNAYVNQLIRCSSSVGANYRASQRAKSPRDFINKLKIVEEAVDESLYWLELFEEVLPEKKILFYHYKQKQKNIYLSWWHQSTQQELINIKQVNNELFCT